LQKQVQLYVTSGEAVSVRFTCCETGSLWQSNDGCSCCSQ